jgi:hypothetical protein
MTTTEMILKMMKGGEARVYPGMAASHQQILHKLCDFSTFLGQWQVKNRKSEKVR